MSRITTLLFPNYRCKILSLLMLHPDQRYHVREIARLTGTAAGSIHRELSKLAQAEILTRETKGNQVYYQANCSGIIYEELASILRKTAGLAEVLAQALTPLADQIKVALVFGSVARGAEHMASDIDLLVVGEPSFTDVITVLYPVQATLQREVNPKIYTLDEWHQRVHNNDLLAKQIMQEPKLLIMGAIDDIEKPFR